ncbi:MAG: HdeD family acid-resistance protein, partial [Verrucomicrobiales bacterium]
MIDYIQDMSDSAPPTAEEIGKQVKSGGGWMIGLGILTVICGIIAIGSPLISGLAVSLMVGIFLAAGGVMQIIHAFKVPSGGGRRIFLILAGLVSFGFGIFMTTCPVSSLLAMTLVLVGFFVFDGICK